MFEWILSKPLLFTMNREKGIALGEGVLIYLGFYNDGGGIRIRHGWINEVVVK